MARKAGSAEFQNYLDSFDRTADGAGSGKGTDRFSGKDIRTAFDNRGDLSKAEGAQMVLDYALDSATEGSKMGGSSQAALDKLRGYVKAGKSNPGQEDKPKPTPTPKREPSAPGSSNAGKATAGDNSIASPISQASPIKISGDGNNTIDQSIKQTQNYDYSVDNSKVLNDNSYRSYGADSGRSSLDGADDSPAAAQRFMDMYIDSNKLNQRSMRNDYEFYGNTDYSANDRFGAETREKGLKDSIQASEDKYKNMNKSFFGGANPFGMNYENPEKPDPIESNAEDIYKQARKDIK